MLSIKQLHNEIEKREERKQRTYHKILEKAYMRIITINEKSNDCYTFFIVPAFVFGVPLYDVTNCVIYVMNDLIARGFKVLYTHPNLLYIDWRSKPKNNQLEYHDSRHIKITDEIPTESLIYHPTDIKTLQFKTNNLFD